MKKIAFKTLVFIIFTVVSLTGCYDNEWTVDGPEQTASVPAKEQEAMKEYFLTHATALREVDFAAAEGQNTGLTATSPNLIPAWEYTRTDVVDGIYSMEVPLRGGAYSLAEYRTNGSKQTYGMQSLLMLHKNPDTGEVFYYVATMIPDTGKERPKDANYRIIGSSGFNGFVVYSAVTGEYLCSVLKQGGDTGFSPVLMRHKSKGALTRSTGGAVEIGRFVFPKTQTRSYGDDEDDVAYSLKLSEVTCYGSSSSGSSGTAPLSGYYGTNTGSISIPGFRLPAGDCTTGPQQQPKLPPAIIRRNNAYERILKEMGFNCGMRNVMNDIGGLDKMTGGIELDENYSGAYDAASKTLKMPLDWDGSVDRIAYREELIHFMQDQIYSGGIGQYYKKPGNTNIEFEAKVVSDLYMMSKSEDGTFYRQDSNALWKVDPETEITTDEYSEFLKSIKGGTVTNATYLDMLEKFEKYTPFDEYKGKIDRNLSPKLLNEYGQGFSSNGCGSVTE
ncbi:MAG: hypothetical protein LBR48_00010 [Dysgonamonadaceae bacterium]|jgi:hypothetical protein|nr:hypothetical protein [Dysgonamonadaceae bacterium]